MNFSYLIASTPFLTPLRSVLEEKKKNSDKVSYLSLKKIFQEELKSLKNY